MLDLEKERNATAAWEKKKKAIDQQINEWKAKYEGSQQELDASKFESCMYSFELLKLKSENSDLKDEWQPKTTNNYKTILLKLKNN
ncbi:PREDICTED: myosin heavy chain-like [Amphimedon queenslandica]|uniref:Uncharacterized protein n=1 Tax=Amphimedon queenslandica TaxID=400682 RepID=A0A1X7T370_AMPQE|nr:PREDICTED: myosin heavy chain-like [Amphimedon queenslandica]|eukprot:XP_019861619.1 PREDICTED: myosin heavy chain-like [Amphimedon queenslandica]